MISGCGSPTEGISELVDWFIQPLVPLIPSFVKDTNDFLEKIRALGPLAPEALLVTVDVTALYPSIPHHDGIESLSVHLRKSHFPSATINAICKLTQSVLSKNVFEFDTKLYLQTLGTAIGTKMAPSYANIFMAVLEEDFLAKSHLKPQIWLRYIDDVFMIWNHGVDQLHAFLEFINNQRPTIKFTHEFSPTKVNFLDVTVILDENRRLRTDLYSKPTDSHQYLHNTSCHPGHIKKSIAFSQAIRIKRICSDRETTHLRCDELAENLHRRGHSRGKVRKEIGRALARNESAVTQPPIRDRVPLVITFHPGLPDISAVLKKYQPLLHQSEQMLEAVPDLPVVSFRNPPNLRKKLVRAKLNTHGSETLDFNQACEPCGDRRCSLCDLMVSTDSIRSKENGKLFPLKARGGSCKSSFCIYCIFCPTCNLQYVGSTVKLRTRLNQHKSSLRLYSKSGRQRNDCWRLYEHLSFHSPNKFLFTILEVLSSETDLRNVETRWIWKLDTVYPKGLNIDDGFRVQARKSRARTK